MNASKSTQKLDDKGKQEEKMGLGTALLTVGAAIGAALLAWGVSRAFSNDDVKMMKAPGRDDYMRRRDFQDNPHKYFMICMDRK
ncbi:hypothetical protein FRX31_003076 [Thalictrum thalictroides]|uniref:Transmembrane protein n=1 Tax=Thalictrum thalictroides TaxID=46969 RepID=A0A7J6XE95_THATH|nr:hypothetical protein FRX31_003076 [Thalictrum thalictroides]